MNALTTEKEDLRKAWLTERMVAVDERFRPARRMNAKSRLRDRNMTLENLLVLYLYHPASVFLLHGAQNKTSAH